MLLSLTYICCYIIVRAASLWQIILSKMAQPFHLLPAMSCISPSTPRSRICVRLPWTWLKFGDGLLSQKWRPMTPWETLTGDLDSAQPSLGTLTLEFGHRAARKPGTIAASGVGVGVLANSPQPVTAGSPTMSVSAQDPGLQPLSHWKPRRTEAAVAEEPSKVTGFWAKCTLVVSH